MIKLTKDQRKALKRIYDRQTLPINYRLFRKSVMGTIGMDNADIVNWAGMWLAIECDGYTHS